jgi:hypothetical protein
MDSEAGKGESHMCPLAGFWIGISKLRTEGNVLILI